MKTLKLLLLALTILILTSGTLSQYIKKPAKLPPKFILGAVVGYNFVVGSANGEATGFSMTNNGTEGDHVFNPQNYGMEQGGGLTVFGKQSINKKRNLYFTGELGYNLFYNTHQNSSYRTKWSIFDLGAGIEFRNRSTPRNTVFIGTQLQYSLIFGGWQTNVTFPDNSVSNVYVKVKPTSRVGISLSTGMEFKSGKKSFLVIGLKGTWANLLPKTTNSTVHPYETNLNDAQIINGDDQTRSKDIIFMQFFMGLNFSIK
jgi:hypothetical protein